MSMVSGSCWVQNFPLASHNFAKPLNFLQPDQVSFQNLKVRAQDLQGARRLTHLSGPPQSPGPRGWERALPAPFYNRVSSAGGPSAVLPVTELRCVCLTITPKINPKMIANLEVIAAGPQCPRVEVIAKLKNQKEVCLDPEAPVMKKIIQKILDSGNKKTKRNALALEKSPGVQ
ncbi:C-X-C motif chemokine 5 [Peromyscus maniculatus bairdii]|uniref:C-X-C motif chemokine 5 n=1 Tax=Peromyscus maniculatus bairdii TaxID=230844 RepID=UPI003FD5D286